MLHGEASGNELRLSKRGVYAISAEGKLRSFRLVRWEQILKTLDAREGGSKHSAATKGAADRFLTR